MINLLVRILLLAGAAVAGWLVTEIDPKFQVIQMVVAVLLFALVVFVLAFWPGRWFGRGGRG